MQANRPAKGVSALKMYSPCFGSASGRSTTLLLVAVCNAAITAQATAAASSGSGRELTPNAAAHASRMPSASGKGGRAGTTTVDTERSAKELHMLL